MIGPDQRVTPLEGLKAMTINVAYQYGEQASKGSLEAGKLADLVILDKNPLKVDPMAIKDIKVLETIKEGKTIYKAPGFRKSALRSADFTRSNTEHSENYKATENVALQLSFITIGGGGAICGETRVCRLAMLSPYRPTPACT